MATILEDNKEKISRYVTENFKNIKIIEHLRTNISAVYKCMFNDKESILKYLYLGTKSKEQSSLDIEVRYQEEFEYLSKHAEKMIRLSNCISFPSIYFYKKIEIDNSTFMIVCEELLPYSFDIGIMKSFKENNNDVIKTTIQFLDQLIDLYKNANEYNFVSHRDLSFDNLMFDINYNLRMIDLGSAKSTEVQTTSYQMVAPTKTFYAAPEFVAIHKSEKSSEDLVKAEIYTIGLLSLSLLNKLFQFNEQRNICIPCGIVYWIDQNQKNQSLDKTFQEKFKNEYINFILINIFKGNEQDRLYKILKVMTDRSVSARIKNFDIIKKHLNGVRE